MKQVDKQEDMNLSEDVIKAISVLKSGKVSKKSKEEDGPNLLSIVKKISRNRRKGQ